MLRPKWAKLAFWFAFLVLEGAGVSVGFLRSGHGSGVVIAGLVALTIVVSTASAASSWRYTSLAAELIDHKRSELAIERSNLRALTTDKLLVQHNRDVASVAIVKEKATRAANARRVFARALRFPTRLAHPELFGYGVPSGNVADLLDIADVANANVISLVEDVDDVDGLGQPGDEDEPPASAAGLARPRAPKPGSRALTQVSVDDDTLEVDA